MRKVRWFFLVPIVALFVYLSFRPPPEQSFACASDAAKTQIVDLIVKRLGATRKEYFSRGDTLTLEQIRTTGGAGSKLECVGTVYITNHEPWSASHPRLTYVVERLDDGTILVSADHLAEYMSHSD